MKNQTYNNPAVTGVMPGDKSGATVYYLQIQLLLSQGLGTMILNVTDDGATTTGVTDLSILGIPPYVTPDEICVFLKIIDKGCRIPLIF